MMSGILRFHRRCGDRVTLLNNDTTAVRNFVEFNHGLVMSAEPLVDERLFQVRIDRKVNVWNGSLEMGVTSLDPEYMEFPATATKLRNTAWIMSGSSIVKDGVTLVNSYGPELDKLREYDCLGVMRLRGGELLFFLNGFSLGVAAEDLPPRVFVVIDLYGQCVQVSITPGKAMVPIMDINSDEDEEDPNNDDTLTEIDVPEEVPPLQANPKTHAYIPMTSDGACALVAKDHLRFHQRCGILVKLSANKKSAERARPLDDYNNGVVMTHRPLHDNELFEIRIDKLVDKWSGSIEVGVTTHNPATIRFPSTMTNMDSGTIMMSGCKIHFNGHGTCMEYGNFNLDELREGDTIGMMRKRNGELHYYINGVDQGVATEKVETQVWGVVDLYGMTVKVSIVDPGEDVVCNINNSPEPDTTRFRPRLDEETLSFLTLRYSDVIIINDGKTGHRPDPFENGSNGILITNRPLRDDELFQVRIDLIIPTWGGSIEIGVTQHTPNDLEAPLRLIEITTKTWAISDGHAFRNGSLSVPNYVRCLKNLKEGDTVGVMRNVLGFLHFFVNNVDLGPAAIHVPGNLYGIVDLYGRAAQATIVEPGIQPPTLYNLASPVSTESNAITTFPEMCFHHVHGRNARLNRNRMTASRTTVYSEFNDAVLFSSRPLKECDMFELRIDKMVDCWIGSLEIGVTAIRPDDLEANGGVGAVAGTATDLIWDTYILSGAAMMKDGECIRSGYPLDLDTLTVGSRVGMIWHADRSLHYYLDGTDMGKAWYVPHLNIYAVVDLYGQCTQVTILQNEERTINNRCANSDKIPGNPRALSLPPPPYWSFSEYCGDNVLLIHDYTVARRRTRDTAANLVFSSAHLAVGEIFEIKIVECKYGFAGSFRMGITDINILNAHVNRRLPQSIIYLPHFTAYIDGCYMKYSIAGSRTKELCSFAPSFEWLRPGDRVGFKRTPDSRVLIYYNSELLETAFQKIPEKVYVVMELYGQVTKIQTVRATNMVNALLQAPKQTLTANAQLTNTEEELSVATVNEVVVSQPVVVAMADYRPPAPLPATLPEAAPEPVGDMMIEPQEPDVTMAYQEPDVTGDPQEPDVTGTSQELNVTAHMAQVTDQTEDINVQPEAAATAETGAESDPLAITTIDTRRRRQPLPYTFYYVHGNNIRLCSSDTVAQRVAGYNKAIAVVSQPLRRGHSFRFRIDKTTDHWSGSVSIGALGSLPTGPELPMNAIYLDPIVWVSSGDILHINGVFTTDSDLMWDSLMGVVEQSVLTIHFRYNGELAIEIDGRLVGNVGTVTRNYSHVFPLIDLYGKVQQVSILLHPHVFSGGASLDLPIIAEDHRNESSAELELEETGNLIAAQLHSETTRKSNKKALSHDSLMEDERQPVHALPGPSSRPDSLPPALRPHDHLRKACQTALHRSLMLTDESVPIDNNDAANSTLHKSNSSQSFYQVLDHAGLTRSELDFLRRPFHAGSWRQPALDDLPAHEQLCDTNIRHNDRYPEASDVDNLDNEIMDALTLETGNLPDLTEEQSSSIDESTRRDDIWSGLLAVGNLNYLNQLMCLDHEDVDGQSLESEWEATGEGCEHLHLVMKYWTFLVQPFPELRRAVSWGQVRCHCANCHPDAPPTLAGTVRIERVDGVAAEQRAFWHVARSTLGSAQAEAEPGPPRRPRSLTSVPVPNTPFDELWFDEEGKPHHTVLVIEIDLDCSDINNDRLVAFLIYLKPHSTFVGDSPPSLDE